MTESERTSSLSACLLLVALFGVTLLVRPRHNVTCPEARSTITAHASTAVVLTGPTGTATMTPIAPSTATSLEELSQSHIRVPEGGPTGTPDPALSDVLPLGNPTASATEQMAMDQSLHQSARGNRDRLLGMGLPSDAPGTGDVSFWSYTKAVRPGDASEAEEQTTSTVNIHSGVSETDQDLQAFSDPIPAKIPPTPPTNTDDPPVLVGKALVVDQDAQVLRVYKDGVVIRTMPVSSGLPPLYTPAFRGHVGHYVGTIYGYGSWADNAWYVFTAGGRIYLHGASYKLSEGVKMYKGLELLGVRPSSHGCIRLRPSDAEWLTQWDPEGVLIVITPLDLDREW